MFGKRHSKVICAAVAAVPALLMISRTAHATGTWIGAVSDSWGDAANWGGTGNPPGSTANNGDAFIGNNSTVFFHNYVTPTLTQANVTRLRIGYGGPGTNNPGAGTLNIDAGILNLDQDSSIGDGNMGTLIISGGTLIQKDTKHIVAGYISDAYIKVTAGELLDHAKYGIEQGAGFSTIELSGGSIVLDKNDNSAQLNVDNFIFTGGTIQGINQNTTINTISGTGVINLRDNGSSSIVISPSVDSIFDGVVNTGAGAVGSGTAGNGMLTKLNSTALTLSAVQGFRRSANVNGGTLTLNYATNPTGIIDDAASISLGGGVLRLESNSSTATSETVGRLSITNNASRLILHNNGAGVSLDARSATGLVTLARSLGATADISVEGGVLGADSNVLSHSGNQNGILPTSLTVNNYADWATNNGSDAIVPYAAYTSADIGTVDPTDATNPTKNLLLSGPQTGVPGGTSFTFNSIKLTSGAGIDMTAGASITLNTNSTQASSTGILANTTGSIQGGTLTVANTGAVGVDLVVVTAADLTIGSNITNDGATGGGSISLTKAGPASLTLSGTNTYSGSTFIGQGSVKIGSATAIPNNSIVVLGADSSAVLDLNGNDLTVGGLITSQGTGTLAVGNGAAGQVHLGGNTLTVNASGGGTFTGAITGTGNVVKDSGGAATFTASNSSYTGTTTIKNGSLTVTSLGNGGTNSSIGASTSAAANLVVDGGTFAYAGRVSTSTDRLFSVGPNGGTISVFANNGAGSNPDGYYGMVNFTNTGTVGMAGSPSSRTLHLNIGSTAISSVPAPINPLESSLAAIIPDSDTTGGNRTNVEKDGIGQFDLTGSSTYTGQTTINAGTLSIAVIKNGGVASPIGASTSDASNLNLNGPGALSYTGTGDSTDRLFNLSSSNGAASTLASNGTGPLSFTNTNSLAGSGTLNLTGTNTGANTLAPALSGFDALTKSGAGLWIVSGNSSYTGLTTLSGGTLSVASIADAGLNSNIGAANNGAQDVVFSGGALRYTGGAASSNRLFTLAGNGTLDASGTGPINFNNTGTIVLNADGNRTLGLTGTNVGANTLAGSIADPTSSTTATFSGSVTKSGTGMWILAGSNTYTGPTTVGGGTLKLTSAAQTPVTTNAGGAVINSGTLILDYSGGGIDQTSTIVGVLQTNLANNNTQGKYRTGHAADPNRGIGYKDDTANSQTILRYSYRGDANLDGTVNALDFNALATNFGGSGKAWVQGDFNYDGTVNTSDFTYLATNFNAAPLGAPALDAPISNLGALVPEPGACAIALMGVGLLARRKRR